MTGAGELDLRLLGAPSVTIGGAPLVVDTRKAIALLAYLAVTDRVHRRDHLAGLLWPDYETDRARGALRRTLSTLRTGLGGGWVGADRETVWCAVDARVDVRVDVLDFRARAKEPTEHAHAASEVCPDCADPLSAAAATYRDRFLAGFSVRGSPEYDDWQQGEADRLAAELHDVLGRLAEAYAVRGEWSAAVGAARRRVGLDPLQEPSHRQLMRLHALAGDRAAAMRQYRECVRVLDHDLGVAPLPETQELYARVTEGALRSADAPEPIPSRSAEAGAAPGGGAERGTSPPLVGRGRELARVRKELEACTSGRLVGLAGEAGVGKSRLVAELVGEAAASARPTVLVRCYEGESGLAYGPVADAVRAALSAPGADAGLRDLPRRTLAEAARLVPELDRGADPPARPEATDPGAQLRFLEALVEVLTSLASGDAGGLLVFEDLHHADAGTRDLAAFVARRVQGRRLLLLATWRPEDGGDELDVRRLAGEAERVGHGALLRLERLDETAVRALADWARGRGLELDDTRESALLRDTEGLPLLCVEYLQALGDAGRPDPASLPGARALLAARLDTLGPLATELAGAGAVLGRRFDFELARLVSGREEAAAVEGTEELLRRGVCAEDREPVGAAPLVFTHELLRQLVLERLSLVRTRLLHLRAADALEGAAERDDALAAAVARHAELGGRDAQAARWHERAGRAALVLPAPEAAVEHLRRARGLAQDPDPGLDEAIADVQVLQGAYAGAVVAYEAAAARLDGARLAEVERKLAELHGRRGRHELAEAHVASALAAADPADEVATARIELCAAANAGHRGDPASARRYAGSALDRARRLGADEEAARAHDLLGLVAWGEGDVEASATHLEQALARLSEEASPAAVSGVLNNLARVRRASGGTDEAVELATRALALSESTRDRHREAALHNNLADALHAAGRQAEAMEHLKRAVSIFADVGQESGPDPDIWMLSHW